MKKIILTLTAVLLLVSCDTTPILRADEYTIVDTTAVNKNGFNAVLSYDIILLNHYDSMYHAGRLLPEGHLVDYNVKPIKLK
jgi:hypothetical protein